MRKGFTLVELVIVIVIIGILAAVAIPKYVDLTTDAKKAATKGGLGGLRATIAILYAKDLAGGGTGTWPSTAEIDTNMQYGIPKNEVNSATSFSVIGTGDPAANSSNGWIYSTASGKIWAANDTSW